jgi:thiol-disulfide isomerase/thioredoxin
MARRVRRLPPRAPRVLALALLVSALVSGANAEATKWTPGEFERSLFATRGSNTPTAADDDVTATPHLLKLYAPWCGHCKKMAPAFDEAATVLRLRNMEVGKVDCADRQSGGAEFCARLNVRGFPQVKLFLGTEDALVDFPMSGDRSSAAMVAFALGGHAARPRQYFREVPRSVRVPVRFRVRTMAMTRTRRKRRFRRLLSCRKPASSDGAISRSTSRSTSRRMFFPA